MQADQTVLSLRPGGGGGNRGSRILGSRFESSAFGSSSVSSSDLPVLRPHGGVLASLSIRVDSLSLLPRIYAFLHLRAHF